MMDPRERKVAFKAQAGRDGMTAAAAAYTVCGVTWFHLSDGIKGQRPMSADVKQKFANYIGHSVEDVFGAEPGNTAAA